VKWLPARPTVYRGIRMRSRLEADFARYLDSDDDARGGWLCIDEGDHWEYEPVCFAGPNGQYLPDFRITGSAYGYADRYIEVKPPAAAYDDSPDFSADPIERFLKNLEIIWESDPRADLYLVFWEYKADEPKIILHADGEYSRLWRVILPNCTAYGVLIWAGRHQWSDLITYRKGLAAVEGALLDAEEGVEQ
jgi:hypothetical protein